MLKLMGKKTFVIFMLKNFVYLNLCGYNEECADNMAKVSQAP